MALKLALLTSYAPQPGIGKNPDHLCFIFLGGGSIFDWIVYFAFFINFSVGVS